MLLALAIYWQAILLASPLQQNQIKISNSLSFILFTKIKLQTKNTKGFLVWTYPKMLRSLPFFSQLYWGRWFQLFISLLLLLSTGGDQIFSTYSSLLKEKLDYSQKFVSFLSSSKELGSILGSFAIALTKIFPKSLVLILVAVLNFLSHKYIDDTIDRKRKGLMMLVLSFFGGFSQSLLPNIAAKQINYFPQNKSMLRNLFKGIQALNGAIIVYVSCALFGEGNDLLLTIAYLPGIISVFGFLSLMRFRPRIYEEREEEVIQSTSHRSCFIGFTLFSLTLIQMTVKITHVGYLIALLVLTSSITFSLFPLVQRQVKGAFALK